MGAQEDNATIRSVLPDPRPMVRFFNDGVVRIAGSRCEKCAYPNSEPLQRCPLCGASCKPEEFGPGAVVFAATVLRVAIPGREPPYALGYIDIDDGPRILAHVDQTDSAINPDDRVRLIGQTPDGDPLVTLEGVS